MQMARRRTARCTMRWPPPIVRTHFRLCLWWRDWPNRSGFGAKHQRYQWLNKRRRSKNSRSQRKQGSCQIKVGTLGKLFLYLNLENGLLCSNFMCLVVFFGHMSVTATTSYRIDKPPNPENKREWSKNRRIFFLPVFPLFLLFSGFFCLYSVVSWCGRKRRWGKVRGWCRDCSVEMRCDWLDINPTSMIDR